MDEEEDASAQMWQWLINIDETLQPRIYTAPVRSLSIYRVTSGLAEQKKGAYMPSTVSLGPYHCGKLMEPEKVQALRRFLFESPWVPFHRLVEAVTSVEEQLKELYEMPDDHWGSLRWFLWMMIVDGFFVLSVLCFLAWDKPFFEFLYRGSGIIPEIALSFKRYWGSYSMDGIRRDMLLLENQLPILLLWKLMEALGGKASDVNNLILGFLNLELQPAEDNEWPGMADAFGLHILDVYRKRKILQEYSSLINQRWSATQLDLAGVRFRKSHSKSFNHITFSRGTLQLPCIDIDDTTETLLLNLIAFESRHVGNNYKIVTHYVHFMFGLINSSSDVALLRNKSIIHLHGSRSDDDVANLIKKVFEGVLVDHDIREINYISMQLRDYLRPWYRPWRAKFALKCFSIVERVSPTWVPSFFKTHWVIFTLLVGFIYFSASVLQTVFAILSYSHQK